MPLENSNRRRSPELLIRCLISCFTGTITQLALIFVPHFFPLPSLLSQFIISASVFSITLGIFQYIRVLLKIRASAPAFVLFHIIFIWVVYLSVISQAVSLLLNILLNMELAILLIGFLRILTSDPGFVCQDPASLMKASISEDRQHLEDLSSKAEGISLEISNEATSISSRRTRYCRSCKAYVMGFDHHCPGFGNCIGQKNYRLFLLLLAGFITAEASYAMLSYHWINKHLLLKQSSSKIRYNLVVSTMNFLMLQVLWQVVFFAWHVYCVCFNIRTEEWINWRRYPEFHVIIHPSLDQSFSDIRFRNPYSKGIFCNVKDFLLG
ncbi:uncharacterized protein LOC130814306 [Amaranthus tricolor]|uniref:uncharacterized protein LOC130814306 n=1 Tax=Amaranthus tricolor TaxID=29722 RepID=UPI00258494B6|nr:uncharacterized protein LOC130814306 [Amaranthus tricolor]